MVPPTPPARKRRERAAASAFWCVPPSRVCPFILARDECQWARRGVLSDGYGNGRVVSSCHGQVGEVGMQWELGWGFAWLGARIRRGGAVWRDGSVGCRIDCPGVDTRLVECWNSRADGQSRQLGVWPACLRLPSLSHTTPCSYYIVPCATEMWTCLKRGRSADTSAGRGNESRGKADPFVAAVLLGRG